MGDIFYFSHQEGFSAIERTVYKVVEAITYVFNISSTEVGLHLLVQKGAHLTEFTI
jgi:hypothetical protein